MKPYRLDKVLDYRKHRCLSARHALAAALADEQTLRENLENVERQRKCQMDELASFSRSDVVNVAAASRRRQFIGQLEIQLLNLDEQLAQAGEVVQQRRQTLVQADQDVKALERLREDHVTEQVSINLRRTEIELGDQWQASHWKW